ncbi:cytochrome b6 [Geomonas sp. Red276]
MEEVSRQRRRFLAKIIALLVGLPLLWRYLVPAGAGKGKVLVRARKSDVPERGALVFREERVALVRSAGDFYGLSLVCTHLGCTVNVTADRLSCPCHGSEFDRFGKVVKGPATAPLKRLKLELRGDDIEVMEG